MNFTCSGLVPLHFFSGIATDYLLPLQDGPSSLHSSDESNSLDRTDLQVIGAVDARPVIPLVPGKNVS